MMRTGRCLCGAVRYVVRGPLRDLIVCHCVECRRWAGRAWAATAARQKDLEIDDDGALTWIESPDSVQHASRGFCSRCGASLFYRAPGSGRTSIGSGTLDEPPALRVAAHIWVDHAAEWDLPPAGVPTYPRSYPEDAPPLGWT